MRNTDTIEAATADLIEAARKACAFDLYSPALRDIRYELERLEKAERAASTGKEA